VLVTAVDDATTDITLPEGLVFTADFDDAHVSGTAACATFSAPYNVSDGGALSIGEPTVSEGSCPGDDGTAQTRYLDALRASTRYEAGTDRLQLTADDGTRLVYSPAPPAASPSASPTS
jgi:heat shock protein HslJ